MICAYDHTLLNKAQMSMTWMFHYAIYERKMELSEFYHMFLNSSIASKFEDGDSSTIAGRSGIELAVLVLCENDIETENVEQIYLKGRTPEYWLGWALSYYQWKRNIRFKQITDAVEIDEILLMYKKYHEMDINHFVLEMDRRSENAFSESALKRLRAYAKAEAVIQLAQALYCEPKDLLEITQVFQPASSIPAFV